MGKERTPAMVMAPTQIKPAVPDEDGTRRVTVWNPKTGKKLSGNAGVFKKNLAKYLRTHPDWVVWTGQDKDSPKRKRADYEGASKRARVDRYYPREYKDIECKLESSLPTTTTLWASLLVVCSEKSILAEVA